MKRRTYVAIIDENKRILVKLSDDKKALSLPHFSSNDITYEYKMTYFFWKNMEICVDDNWKLILNTYISPYEGTVDEQFLIYEIPKQKFDLILAKKKVFKSIDVTNDTNIFINEKEYKLSKSLVRFFTLF